ncbi:MAG TPA: arylamine N-acetyltransferase, partial [Anaerolineales bacterium]|nr:arylamine N-acetyltransferase [Anaerolineales bacterium]
YELNGLFGGLLADLGFRVEMLSARVARPDGSFGPDFDYIHKGVREETVFVNESVNNEIPEKKVCLGVYTPKHTFFSGVHTTVDQNSVREETLLIGTDQVQEAMEKHFDIIWKPKG